MTNFELTIGGQKIHFKMSILAFRLYCEQNNIELVDIGADLQKRSVFGIADMLYAAHVAYCETSGSDNVYTKNDATEWIGELDEGSVQRINDAILDTKMLGKTLRGDQVSAKKKPVKAK